MSLESGGLTCTGVGREAPGQCTHGFRVLHLPQILELGKLTGCTDDSA